MALNLSLGASYSFWIGLRESLHQIHIKNENPFKIIVFEILSTEVKQDIIQTVFLSVGGVAGVLILVAVVLFYRRRNRQTLNETPGEGPKRK